METVPRRGSEAPLVGRVEELARLTAALDAARQRRPAAILVAGDAGVGKTRLLAELTTTARASDATVLVGHCVDLGQAGLPYLPFAEALRPVAERSLPALVPLLPVPGAGPSTTPASEGDFGQLQLFDAVSGVLAELAAENPVLLVIEDLHWADQSTRDLLSFLLARLRTERLAIVASYRADDLHRRHPLRPLLAELVRLPVVERIDLAPFTASEMREYLQVLHGAPLPEATVRRILDRSEGNAFFAEELLAAGLDRDTAGLPTGLADVLLAGLERLAPAVQHVVRVAAVAGRRVRHALLQRAVDLPDGETEEALREAVTRYVLVPEGGETYAFRHALLQEAVYADLLPGERVRLHAAYARVLAEEPPGSPGVAAELAFHCQQSHDLAGSLTASVRAAAEASAMRAPAEALRHLEHALQLWAAVPDAETVAGADAVHLGLRAANAASACGELTRAAALAADADAQVDPVAEPILAANVKHKLAHHLLDDDRPEAALATATAALRLVPVEPPSPERTWAVAVSARAAVRVEDFEEARRFADEALAAARSLALPDAEADALATLAVLAEYEGDPDLAAKRLADARDRAAAIGDLAVQLRVSYNLAANRFYQGQLDAAAGMLDEAIALADRHGLTWSGYGIELRVLLVIVRYMTGDWDGSLRAAAIVEQVPDAVVARLASATLCVEVGRGMSGAMDRLRQVRETWHYDPQNVLLAGGAGADLLQWHGDYLGARAWVDEVQQLLGKAWGTWQLGGIWLAAIGVSAEADRAAEARLRGDSGTADAAVAAGSALVEHARTAARLGRPRAGRLGPEGRAWLARVEAEWSRLQGLADPAPWPAAVAAFDFGYTYEVARCRWRLAEALLAAERRDEAAEAARAAYETAVRLGAGPLRDAVEALVRRGRLDIGLPARIPDDVLLTPRERDVLALLAEGRTNRQIGRTLFISEKTASVHVSNILAKLGASGRAEAVTLAHRRGLLTTGATPSPERVRGLPRH
jgi:DNA-binding CsgD family transcriptional regulator/tetratricopeptide (TPR) repeat protein